ncbi:GlsB/YeaQ/YmgE family stress response membrane protein [Marinitenerispora sediminis]|uniref:GlsB/YeaQ/YmgE family stress response membrane protein n=1 Tax=Marinitenerispora sediminis TaxID=1931232 RepID=A0A368T524_9ACTN|nr:GlsB/YeaQ/YmgE family stress response membrane protein [Marinitenerispora sediminis]RCV57795.1 hypothetical protein DEF28_01120 [Marinitenerispora sediminis]RCV58364.1 hypothetical protein DEF24_13620 [Marinitenerispora sediminis]RCV59540.1 hypothetical protein DEF23_07090 [Marinitenerispora sediminis]
MAGTGIISAFVVGLVIGALARPLLPRQRRMPLWVTVGIGIAAALAGTAIGAALEVGTFLTLVVQALLAILAVYLLAGSRARGPA